MIAEKELFGRIIDNELIGLIEIKHVTAKKIELKYITVKSGYRRQRIGRNMIKEYIKENEIKKIVAIKWK